MSVNNPGSTVTIHDMIFQIPVPANYKTQKYEEKNV